MQNKHPSFFAASETFPYYLCFSAAFILNLAEGLLPCQGVVHSVSHILYLS